MASQSTPWAVLLCKFKDDLSDPPVPRATFERFFTAAGAGTFHAPRFFADCSHGKLDLSASQVFGWLTLDLRSTDSRAYPDGPSWLNAVIRAARGAARKAGVPLERFFADIVSFNTAVGGTFGGSVDGRPYAFGDHRWVANNGTQSFGQEMGHGYGLDHSRLDGVADDYMDPWDAMSAANAYSGPDPDYAQRGPGLNAWNMRGRGWLDETRVLELGGGPFTATIALRPLYRRELPGPLVAELPGVGGHGAYLVELRLKQDWDIGIPESAVLVHRYEGNHSYLMKGAGGQPQLVAGGSFASGGDRGPRSEVQVLHIDEPGQAATVRLTHMPAVPRHRQLAVGQHADGRLELVTLGVDGHAYRKTQVAAGGAWERWSFLGGDSIQEVRLARNADGRLELFALALGSVHHKWQQGAGGAFGDWSTLGGSQLREIQVGSNADGRLELFALGGDRKVYHRWQTTPNGGWNEWSTLGGSDLQQLSLARNADGRLELFALGGDRKVYHRWQLVPDGDWGEWASLGGQQLRQLRVAEHQDGRLELFALGGDRKAYHRGQAVPNGSFGEWSSLAGTDLQELEVGRNADGRLELFALGGDHGVYHRWQSAPGGGWQDWSSLQGVDIRALLPARDAAGRLGILVIGGDGNVYQRWQRAPNGGWSEWSSVG